MCLRRWRKADFLKAEAVAVEKAAAVFSSLTTRAALFTIITCSVPLLLVGWYFTDQMTKSLTQAAIQRNNQVADRIVNDIGTFILAQKNFLVLTSAKAEMQSMQPETMSSRPSPFTSKRAGAE